MENKYATQTPGPWKMTWGAGRGQYPDGSPREYIAYRVGAAPNKPEIYREDLRDNALTVAECGENEANARLIAAAPALLEACKAMKELLDQSDTRYYIGHELGEYSRLHDAINKANRAIAKAEGR